MHYEHAISFVGSPPCVLLRQLTALSSSKRLTETAFTSLLLTTCLLFPNLILPIPSRHQSQYFYLYSLISLILATETAFLLHNFNSPLFGRQQWEVSAGREIYRSAVWQRLSTSAVPVTAADSSRARARAVYTYSDQESVEDLPGSVLI